MNISITHIRKIKTRKKICIIPAATSFSPIFIILLIILPCCISGSFTVWRGNVSTSEAGNVVQLKKMKKMKKSKTPESRVKSTTNYLTAPAPDEGEGRYSDDDIFFCYFFLFSLLVKERDRRGRGKFSEQSNA